MTSGIYYPYDDLMPVNIRSPSLGKRRIDKAVEFTYTGIRNIVNLGFGDLLPDGQ